MEDTEVITALQRFKDYWTPERLHESIALLQSNGILTIPDAIAALSHDDADVRLLVVEILAELDPIEASLPSLIDALKDPDRIVRIAAVEPVARFGSNAQAAVPILETWLDDETEYVRIAAATAIAKIDPTKIPDVMPVLLDGLKSEHSRDRADAAYGIGELGEAGSKGLPLLEELLIDERVAPRLEAASAISKITGDPRTEMFVAVDLLGAEDWIERHIGAGHLGCMGAVAAPALPDLRRASSDEDPAVRTAAKVAIERIEGA